VLSPLGRRTSGLGAHTPMQIVIVGHAGIVEFLDSDKYFRTQNREASRKSRDFPEHSPTVERFQARSFPSPRSMFAAAWVL
jgi:hypothetical protein